MSPPNSGSTQQPTPTNTSKALADANAEKLLNVLVEAFLTDEVENAATALKDPGNGIDGKSKKARIAIRDSIVAVFGDLFNSAVPLIKVLGDKLDSVRIAIDETAAEQIAFRETLKDQGLEEFLRPNNRFLQTLEENLAEKLSMAKFLTAQYFTSRGFRCFVQGSSLAYLMGKDIAENGGEGILIHTNSTVMHLTILRERTSQFVYTFCGGSYDSSCAAWLFDNRDIDTPKRLRELFSRQHDPLEVAFVMPLCVTDSDLYFRRAEAASLVEILGAEAKQLVVCVVADRFADADRDQAHLRQFYPVPLAKPTEKIHLVVSGNVKTSISQERLRDNFAGKGMKMTWIPSPDRSSDP